MGLPVAYVGEGVGLAVERGEPRFGRIRDPAVAARVEDGVRGRGLEDERGDPDRLGPGLHQDQVQDAVRRVGHVEHSRMVLEGNGRTDEESSFQQ